MDEELPPELDAIKAEREDPLEDVDISHIPEHNQDR